MNHLGFSVGGTKIIGLLASAKYLLAKGYRPDIVSGNSAGSIVALLTALNRVNEGVLMMKGIKQSSIFSVKPLSIKAIYRLIFKKSYGLGEMNNLLYLLKETIPETLFKNYTYSNSSPDCIVGAVNLHTGKYNYWNLKDQQYEKALQIILASCAFPIISKPIKIDGELYIDGGLRNFNHSKYILRDYDIKNHISVYSRPEKYIIKELRKFNFIKVFGRIVDIIIIELSKKTEYIEKDLTEDRKINSKIIYMPDILEGAFDINKTRLNLLYNKTKEIILRDDITQFIDSTKS